MPELPLLLFPEPTTTSRKKLTGGPSSIRYPDLQRQIERVTPKFQALQEAFEKRRIEILQGAAGVDPEQVIVFETIGKVEDFTKAVSKIEGLEWLGEIDLDDIAPDDDFYNEKHPDKPLTGRLYLVMSNQRALQEMLSLWGRVHSNENLNFRRGELRGLSKFKEVFLYLKDIRRWGVQDRMSDTHIIDYWTESIEAFPDQTVKFEIELWHRNSSIIREQNTLGVRNLVEHLGGKTINQCAIEEIGYNALLVELPPNEINTLINSPSTELVKSDAVMFFRPRGQSIVERPEPDIENIEVDTGDIPIPSKHPVAGILDGLPLMNHNLLANRIILDDPEEWEVGYQAVHRKHGTAMSSLVIHGDLNDNEPPIDSLVYLRPIFKPTSRDRWAESVPDNIMVVDLIHRAVKRMFEGESGSSPYASTVKVINLSLGDRYRHFFQIISPLGRLIDWLSFKYGVLFVISAGNHVQEMNISVSDREFSDFTEFQREKEVLKTCIRDSRNRRLISPAESMNAITVGGLHSDSSDFDLLGRINPYASALPSITNPIGGGFNRSIKPDIVYMAGRQLLNKPTIPSDTLNLGIRSYYSPPGIKVAVPSTHGGLSEVNYCRGSSNSAALTTRASIMCYEKLNTILTDHYQQEDFSEYEVSILKALIIHGASWGEVGGRIYNLLHDIQDKKRKKQIISRLIGYGLPDFGKAMYCNNQRATTIGFGKLKQEEAHLYELPLPTSLGSIAVRKRITVTLAYISPIISSNMKYRHSNIWFSLENNSLANSRLESDDKAVRRGTVQHEIFESEGAVPIEDGETLIIKVNSKPDAIEDRITEIHYGLVISIEVAEGLDIPIYEEVRTRIATAIQIQQST